MKININDENILEKKSDISSISISKNENIRIVKDKKKVKLHQIKIKYMNKYN